MPADPSRRFNPESAAEILARAPEQTDWLWQNFIATGDLFVLAAYAKGGKTTFEYAMALAIVRGDEFLDYPTYQSAVLILALEEHCRDVNQRLRKLGLEPDDRIFVHCKPLTNSDREINEVRDHIQTNNIRLVLVDSLPYWWSIRNENDNAEILAKVEPLHRLARETNTAVGLIHHESKFGGRDAAGQSTGDGKSIRGGGALFGVVDQALLLDKPKGGSINQRILRAIGRHSESPAELRIELYGSTALTDPRAYGYRNLGTPDELSHDALKSKIFYALTTAAQEIKIIVEQSAVHEKTVRESLAELVDDGKVVCTGKGVRGDPYKYALTPDVPTAIGEAA